MQAGVLEPWIFCRLPESVLVAGMEARKAEFVANHLKEQGYSPMGSPVAAAAGAASASGGVHKGRMEMKATLVRQISASGFLGEGFQLLEDVVGELRLFKRVMKRALNEYFRSELGGRDPPRDAFANFESTLTL